MTLYAWHDGIEGVDLFPGLSLISFGRALSLCQVYLDFDPWLPNRFPVLSSGGCSHFVCCGPIDHGALWYSCPEFDDTGWVADSLLDWFEGCVRIYEEDAFHTHPHRGLEINGTKAAAISRKMEEVPPDVMSLVGALTSEDRVRRIKARSRLMAHEYPEAVEPVLELAQATNYEVVEVAADILTCYDREDLVAPLIKIAAAWELRKDPMGNPVLFKLYRFEFDSLSLLTDALQADDEELRAAAATCASALRDARAFPALHGALSDPSAKVRSAASKALERLKHQGS